MKLRITTCQSQWPRGVGSNGGIVGSNPSSCMDVCPRFSVLCCPVQVEALRWVDPPCKESYDSQFQEFILTRNKPEANEHFHLLSCVPFAVFNRVTGQVVRTRTRKLGSVVEYL